MRRESGRRRGQTATEYMLIISVVVIAVVAAAYKFVPIFQQGVEELGNDVESILSTGKIGNVGTDRGGGMAGGDSARIASRPCDGSPEALRYESMFAPPPCEKPRAKDIEWTPSPEPALPLAPPLPPSLDAAFALPRSGGAATGEPEHAPAPACTEDPVVYLSSARLGRRSRSRIH